MKLWLGIESLVELNNPNFYLYGAARNKVISHYRKKKGQLKGGKSLIAQLDLLESSADEDIGPAYQFRLQPNLIWAHSIPH